MIRVLLTLTYVLTSIIVGSAIGLFQGYATGILCGFTVFLFLRQLDAELIRRRDRKVHKKEIDGLKRANTTFEKALAETRTKMDEVTKAVEARASAQGKKIVSELQVLESLMREFAQKIASKAKVEAIDELQAERRARDTRSFISGIGEPELLETIRASLEENRVDLISSPSSACRRENYASMRRCRGCAPRTARSSCRRNTSKWRRPRA